MRGVTKQALATFRPLLNVDDAAYARLEYELLTLPARTVWLLTPLFVIAVLLFLILLPRSIFFDYAPSSNMSGILQYNIVVVPSFVFSFIGLYRGLYQLRQVNRIHRMAHSINLYQAPPLYAFSAVTARLGIGILLPTYFVFAARPEMTFASPILISGLLAAVVVAIASFLLPLREMHARLVYEKARVLREVNSRFENLTARVHNDVDENEFQQMDKWNQALSNLVIERDTLEKIPTWPWERGTLTGFLTALILPIVLWLITRLLEQFL